MLCINEIIFGTKSEDRSQKLIRQKMEYQFIKYRQKDNKLIINSSFLLTSDF